MKKFALLTTPFLCMSAVALNADSLGEMPKADSGYARLIGDNYGQQPVKAAHQKKDDMQSVREITPQVEPKVTHWADPFITAEFIWWTAEQDGMEYANTGVGSTPGFNAQKGSVHAPDFDFEPGFKLGFGLKFKHDGWDVYGNYTWLSQFSANGSAHSKTNSDVVSMWEINDGINLTGLHMNHAHVHWDMQFNALDLELGRNFYISPRLTLRPHFGFKFGWIDQDYHVKYEGVVPVAADYSLKMDQDFFGVGIRTGLDTVWYFANHFGLYGDFAFAAMWSDFDTHRKDHYATNQIAKYRGVNTHNHFKTLTEVLELGIGIRYDTTFFLGDYACYIQAGWEEQIWFNQNQFQDLSDDITGNLTFQGLSIKAGLMF